MQSTAVQGGGGGKRRIGRGKKRHIHDAGELSAAQLALAGKLPRKPLEGEDPAATLRVRVVRAENLVAKDRNGASDP